METSVNEYACTESAPLPDRECYLPVSLSSESTSIPTNPRTTRAVGYAFVDLGTATEAQRAIQELSGKEILERKVSVQLAKSPQTAAEKAEAATSGGEAVSGNEGRRRNAGGRGRGRGRGRYGRGGRGGRVSDPFRWLLRADNHQVFCTNHSRSHERLFCYQRMLHCKLTIGH